MVHVKLANWPWQLPAQKGEKRATVCSSGQSAAVQWGAKMAPDGRPGGARIHTIRQDLNYSGAESSHSGSHICHQPTMSCTGVPDKSWYRRPVGSGARSRFRAATAAAAACAWLAPPRALLRAPLLPMLLGPPPLLPASAQASSCGARGLRWRWRSAI